MNHIRENLKVTYKSKDGTNSKEFDAVDFISSLVSHIPNKCEQMVRYNGYYSNVCQGRRKKDNIEGPDFVVQDDEHTKGANKSWARLIKKIYEVDPPNMSQMWRANEDYCLYRGL